MTYYDVPCSSVCTYVGVCCVFFEFAGEESEILAVCERRGVSHGSTGCSTGELDITRISIGAYNGSTSLGGKHTQIDELQTTGKHIDTSLGWHKPCIRVRELGSPDHTAYSIIGDVVLKQRGVAQP